MELLSLFDVLVVNEDAGSKFELFIDGIDAFKIFSCENNKNIQPIIKYIDNSVNTDNTEAKVLALLSKLVEQCSAEVLIANLEKWVTNIRKVLRNDTRQYMKTWAAELLCKLLSQAAEIPELHRKVSVKMIPKFMQELTVIVSELPLIFLLCLQTYMQHYPGSCGPFRKHIEQSLLTFVGRSEKYITELAASCYSLLPTVGSGGTQSVIHVENWQKQLVILTGTLTQSLNCLLEDLETENVPVGKKEIMNLPDLEDLDSAVRFSSYYLRARSLCVFLVAMIKEPMKFCVNIPLDRILSIVVRILSLNIAVLVQSKNTDSTLLTSTLPHLQSAALNILNSLFSRVESQILRRANTVNTLFSKMLKWVRWNAEAHFESEKPLNDLRVVVYQVLRSWILLRGCMPSANNCDDIYVEHLLKEVTPEVQTVQLNTSDAVTEKKLHGRKKLKVKPIIKTHVTPTHKIDRDANRHVCIEALKALSALTYTVGPTLKQETIKTLRDKVVSLVCVMQQKVLRHDIPYDDGNCRKELYRLLLAVTMVPHARCPSPLNSAMSLFSRGKMDKDEEVKYVCVEAMAFCGPTVCPLMPPMFFTPPPVAPSNVHQQAPTTMDIDMFGSTVDRVEVVTRTRADVSTSTAIADTDHKGTQTERVETYVVEEPDGNGAEVREFTRLDSVEVEELPADNGHLHQEVSGKDNVGRGEISENVDGEVPHDDVNDKSPGSLTPDDDLKIVYEDPGVPWVHSSEDSCSIIEEGEQVTKRKADDQELTLPSPKKQMVATEETNDEIQEMMHSFVDTAPD